MNVLPASRLPGSGPPWASAHAPAVFKHLATRKWKRQLVEPQVGRKCRWWPTVPAHLPARPPACVPACCAPLSMRECRAFSRQPRGRLPLQKPALCHPADPMQARGRARPAAPRRLGGRGAAVGRLATLGRLACVAVCLHSAVIRVIGGGWLETGLAQGSLWCRAAEEKRVLMRRSGAAAVRHHDAASE